MPELMNKILINPLTAPIEDLDEEGVFASTEARETVLKRQKKADEVKTVQKIEQEKAKKQYWLNKLKGDQK